jgi:hypothetical protein
MKNFIKLLSLGFIIIFHSCKTISYSSQVNFLSKETSGIYNIKATGYSTTSRNSILEAERNAFKVIIFKGLPGSDLTVPLVDNESNSMSQNKVYYDRFFDSGYRSFIMNRNENYLPKKNRNGFQSEVTLKINLESLRRELEQNQIIRKFGY